MRKKRSDKRRTMADPRFNDVMIAKFVNNIMIQGKKNTARKIVYEALDIVGKKAETDPIEVFRKAIQNASPAIEIRPRRVGGATYQVPMEVREERRAALAIRWIKKYASERRDRSMARPWPRSPVRGGTLRDPHARATRGPWRVRPRERP